MRKFLFLIAASALFSCSTDHLKLNYPADTQIAGLATPVPLEIGKATVLLTDYFLDVNQIDSVGSLPGIKSELSADKKELKLTFENNELPVYTEMKVWIKKIPYSLLLEKSRKLIQKISFNPAGAKYGKVQCQGDFNGGSTINLSFKDSVWMAWITMDQGKYKIQFLADGKEIAGSATELKAGKWNTKNLPVLTTQKFEKGKITLKPENKPESVIVFWQNYRLPEAFVAKSDTSIEISLPAESNEMDRSFIRVWSCNKDGKSNNLLIPLAKDEVVLKTSELTRADKEASVFYFMMVDRFNNGKKENDKPVVDKEVDPKANYQGGDLAGITQKIKDGYFEKLGINTIWLSPITQNPWDGWNEYPAPHRKYSGYHGYWPVTLTTVDKRLGSDEEFKELLKEAHNNNINVILDFVSHHVHQNSKLIQDHPDWKTPLDLPDGKKNLRIWDDQRLTTWFDPFLPTLDLSRPEIANVISDSVVFWAKNYEIDGFRHDATKHIPESYWRLLTEKLKKQVIVPQNKKLYQIGETFGSRDLIGSYVGSGQQDGQFDFNLYFDAREVFAQDNQSFERLNHSLQQSFDYYGTVNLMGNITGNHDLTRFITLASGALKPGEDEKEVGWKRDVQIVDPVGYKKLSSLTAFIMTIPGIPVIYYGDEIGMVGAGDPDNRRMMKFNDLTKDETSTKELAEKLIKIRSSRLELVYGNFKILKLSSKVYAYSRSYFGATSLVLFNKDNKTQDIDLELQDVKKDAKPYVNFGSNFTLTGTSLKVTVPANGFEIITL
jgi:cyclomaltodextrinase / maltogenic alpha-amylase / neopullulanase